MNKRRRLLLAALAAPLAAAAQAPRVRRIGILVAAGARGPTQNMDVFFKGMRELGYVLEKNLHVETRYAEHVEERLPALAVELVKADVELIVAAGPAATRAARAATATVPIVMGTVDPVEQGLIQSLAQPGGNMTGFCFLSADTAQKQLSLLKQAFPRTSRVGVIANPAMVKLMRAGALGEGARPLGLELAFVEVSSDESLEPGIASLRKERVDAFIVVPEPNLDRMRERIAALAARDKLPGMYSFRFYVDAGGLMSYGPSLRELIALWPGYVDKILKGARPGDLPVQLPTKYELVLSQRAARELGITFPQSLMLAADATVN